MRQKMPVASAASSAVLLFVSIASSFLLPVSLASQAAQAETLVGIVGNDFVILGADSSVSQSISLTASNVDKISILSEPFPAIGDDDNNNDEILPWAQQAIVAAAAGDSADSDKLIGFLRSYCTLEEYGNGVGCDVEYPLDEEPVYSEPGLSVESLAHFCRQQIHARLRRRERFNVCLLIAGMMMVGSEETTDPDQGIINIQLQNQVRTATAIWDKAEQQQQTKNENDTNSTSDNWKDRSTKLKPHLYWLDEYGSLQKLQYGAHGYGSNFILSILDNGYRPNMSREEAIELMRDCFLQLRSRYIFNSPQPPSIKCIDKRGCTIIPQQKSGWR
jgi:20S proteasome alpha/beta subunit